MLVILTYQEKRTGILLIKYNYLLHTNTAASLESWGKENRPQVVDSLRQAALISCDLVWYTRPIHEEIYVLWQESELKSTSEWMQGLNSMGNREKNGNAAVSDLHATPLEQHYPRSETLTRPHHLHSWKTKLREHLSPWLPSGRRESLWTRPPRPPTPKGHRTQVPVHTTSYPHLQIPPSAKRGQAVSWLLVWSAKTDTQQRQRQRQTQSSAAAACRLRQDCNTTMGNGGERGKGGKATRQWCGRSKWWGWGGEWETAWKECDFFCAKQNINELCDRRCCSVQFGMKGEQKRQVFRRQPMARVAIFFCGL